jgi:hypothetical protein
VAESASAGNSLNQKRLDELQMAISTVRQQFVRSDAPSFQAEGAINLVSDCARSSELLSQFDNHVFKESNLNYEFQLIQNTH